MKKAFILLLICLCLIGCNKGKERETIWETEEQTFQLTVDKACQEHNHKQPTIHHPDLDGKMRDYVFNGEEWKEIIYDKELTKWARERSLYWGEEPRTGTKLRKRKNRYKQNLSDKFIFSNKWERLW